MVSYIGISDVDSICSFNLTSFTYYNESYLSLIIIHLS